MKQVDGGIPVKVFVGQKKDNGKYRYGVTVIDKSGKVVYSATKVDSVEDKKYENVVKLMLWVSSKLKWATMTGGLGEEDKLHVFIDNKTLYTWFTKEVAPEPYTELFSDLMLELSFIVNPVEIIFSETASKKVSYKSSNKEVMTSSSDLLSQFGGLVKI